MLNLLVLEGKMTSEANLKESAKGFKYTSFRMAFDNKMKYNKSEPYARAYINCVAYKGVAEKIAKLGRKGDKIICKGALSLSMVEEVNETRKLNITFFVNEVCLIQRENFDPADFDVYEEEMQ